MRWLKAGRLLGLVTIVAAVFLMVPSVVVAAPVLALPGVFAQLVVGAGILGKAAGALVLGGVIWAAINGIKDQFPTWTAAHPGALKIFNAVGALLGAWLVCVGGSHPEMDKSIFELLPCVGMAAVTFLTAAGIHWQTKANNDARESGGKPGPVK